MIIRQSDGRLRSACVPSAGHIESLFLNSANANTGLNGHLDVAMVAPRWAPRVAHNVVVDAVCGGAKADNCNCMIKTVSARCALDDSRRVILEDSFVSLDGYRHNSLTDGSYELGRVVLCHVGIPHNRSATICFLDSVACTGCSMA